jgi:hypothetical protein
VELFFQIALGSNLISTADANNRTDIAYLCYLPFCHLFVSSDRLHERCAPHFLRADQSFAWGPDLKADLHRLMSKYADRPDEEKEQGLMKLAPTPPGDDTGGLVAQLWDHHFGVQWRDRTMSSKNGPQDKELVDHINRIADAPSVPREQLGVDPANPDFVVIKRRVSKRRGGWWQLPKDLDGEWVITAFPVSTTPIKEISHWCPLPNA